MKPAKDQYYNSRLNSKLFFEGSDKEAEADPLSDLDEIEGNDSGRDFPSE